MGRDGPQLVRRVPENGGTVIDLDSPDPAADRMHLAKAIAWFALALILGVLAVAVG